MAVIQLSGFETGSTNEAQSGTGTFSIQNTTVRTGSYALRVNPTTTATGNVRMAGMAATGIATSSFNVATLYQRFYFRIATAPASSSEEFLVVLDTGGSTKCTFRINSSRQIESYNNSTVLQATGSTALSTGTWYRIEVQTSTGSGSQAYEVKINGTTELSGSMVMLTNNHGSVRLGKGTNRNGQSIDFYYDDWIASDSAYPGAGECKRMAPNANGSTAQWTSGTGSSNYAEVDEVTPDDDTTYIQSNGSASQVHLVALDSASNSGISGTINAVKGYARTRENATGSSSTSIRLRSGSTNSDSTGNNGSTTYLDVFRLLATDPADSSAWTLSDLDGLEVGVVEANAVAIRCTTLCVMVDYIPTTTISSAQDGNWSSTSTWTGGVVPGNGATASILSGHDVTVDTNTTVGHSPQAGDGTAAIAVAGTLAISTGVTLTCRGDIKLNNAPVTLDAGSTFKFDASQAATPSSARYVMQIGTDHNQTSARLNINGSSTSRCSFLSDNTSSAANGRIIDNDNLQGGLITGSYCDFTRIGDSSNAGIKCAVTSSSSFSLSNCIFDACGQLTTTYNIADTTTFTVDNCTWKNTAATTCMAIGANARTSGTRRIRGCVFDKNCNFYPPEGITFGGSGINDWNYWHDHFDVTNAAWDDFQNFFLRMTSTSGQNIAASVLNGFVYHSSTDDGPHYIQVLTYARNMTVDGLIFESACSTSGANGDCLLIGTPGSAVTATVQNCIVLPHAGGNASGTLVSALGNANTSLSINHNTGMAGSQGLVAVGETYAGFTGMVTSFKSNLAWDNTTARGYLLYDSGTDDTVSNLVTSANANYNGTYNILAGSNLKGYNNLEFSSGSPGANDVSADPQFVDPDRDLAKWDAYLGGAGTAANALTELRKKNDASGYKTEYNVPSLLAYVREGFRPRNSSYATAGHDGNTIGAVTWMTPRAKRASFVLQPPSPPIPAPSR